MSYRVVEERREFLPAAGRNLFLPLYDPFVSMIGGDRARRTLVNQANIQPGQRMLDIGCGTGTLVVLLKRLYSDINVVGLDPDPKALKRAKAKAERARVPVKLDQGFGDKLPYQQGTFDRVFSSFMFHHLEEQNREQTLSEVFRVLNTGGSFHLLDFAGGHGSHGLHARLFHSSERLKDNSVERMLELMKRAGFKQAKKTSDGSMLFGLLRTAYYEGSKY